MYRHPVNGFRGFLWEPSTEQDVVVLFGLLLNELPIAVAVSQAWTPFPDCIAIKTAPDAAMQVVHVEFEYRSSSFWSHRSEWRQLALAGGSAGWWVVCWHDDLDNRRRQDLPGLEVISLRELLVKKGRPYAEAIVLNWYDGDPSDPIRPKDVESKFDWRSQGLSRAQQRIIDRLRHFDSADYALEWLPRPDIPCFTVRISGVECFKVSANGTIAFPCHRWPEPLDRRTAVLEKLAEALGNEWFKGRETKKKSCELTYLFRGPEDIEPLVEALRKLSS